MKKLLSFLLLCLVALPLGTAAPSVNAMGMYDEAVAYLRSEGIAQGYIDGSFRPEQNINRAELVKIMMNATSEGNMGNGSHCFQDVGTEWFAPYVCAAKDHHMVSGYPDGMFRPEKPVSYAEAASLVVRAYEGYMFGGATWYDPYIHTLQSWNAIPPTAYDVHAPLTRGEMAYMIWKAEQKMSHPPVVEEAEDVPDNEENDQELDISIRTLSTTFVAGQTVTYLITIENDGNEDIEVNVRAELERGLKVQDAPGSDEEDDRDVEWEEVSIDEDEEETLTLVALIESGTPSGEKLTLDIEVGDDTEDFDIVVSAAPQNPTSPVGDPVLHWNAVALQANANDHTSSFGDPEQGGPGLSSRALAIVHIAMFEAVNSIDRSYKPFIAYIPVAENQKPSFDSAVAYAAHRTLVALYPRQKNLFDAALQNHMALVPAGTEKTLGEQLGQAAATQILNARANDGSVTDYIHEPTLFSGRHRVDPMNPGQPFMGAKWGTVKPFVMTSGTQFRAPPPPDMHSKEYADAYNEVKLFGGDGVITPTVRTREQTEIGLFWAYDGVNKIGTPPRMYNQIARAIAQQKGNSVIQNARLFALINIAQADGGIAAWESKYLYDLWRPIIGIREADAGTGPLGIGDNNPLTTGDANWTPLGAPMSNSTKLPFTPPFPAYPSGHATFGAAVFRTIENFYGTDNIPFTITSDELNGVTTDEKGVTRPLAPRSFTRLSDAMKENAQSRIYLGVHWQFDQKAGMDIGTAIADYTYRTILQPVK